MNLVQHRAESIAAPVGNPYISSGSTEVPVQDLWGRGLDWAVASLEGYEMERYNDGQIKLLNVRKLLGPQPSTTRYAEYSPSTRWDQMGDIIDAERISVVWNPESLEWVADHPELKGYYCSGGSATVAAARVYIAAGTGLTTFLVPNELLETQPE